MLQGDLKNSIIDTTVISGHEKDDTENFISTDKLYLLSTTEVWGETTSTADSAKNLTRQLDYYKNIGVTNSNFSGAIKKKGDSASYWWLRAASSGDNFTFLIVNFLGRQSGYFAYSSCGVSPVFRIG